MYICYSNTPGMYTFLLQVLKGHDDHVITCLQFCGNRIVSGSDDNTLKVWSAVTGKVSSLVSICQGVTILCVQYSKGGVLIPTVLIMSIRPPLEMCALSLWL